MLVKKEQLDLLEQKPEPTEEETPKDPIDPIAPVVPVVEQLEETKEDPQPVAETLPAPHLSPEEYSNLVQHFSDFRRDLP